MLLRQVIVFLVFVTASFAGDDAQQHKYLKLYETFDAEIGPKLPLFTFRIFQNLESNKFDRIEVLQGEDEPKLLQVLEGFTADLPGDDPDYFRNPDVNFDGYADVLLLASSAAGNRTHRVWLYDRDLRAFVLHQALSALPNLEVHPDSHTLSSKSESAGGYTLAVYGFERDTLVQLEEESRTWVAAECRFLKTLKKRKNGQLALVSQETTADSGRCKAK